eukprot:RCo044797
MAGDPYGDGAGVVMELEHAIGFSPALRGGGGLVLHPNGREFLYASGACVVVGDVQDPHNQSFLRGHDDDVTALAVSSTGRLVASGQRGANADVVVWDFEDRRVRFRLDEHDHGIAAVALSEDERLLLSVGVRADRRLVVWDLSCGGIVCSAPIPVDDEATAAAWGGKMRDVKRRDTGNYQFAVVAGPHLLSYVLNPVAGTLELIRPVSQAGARTYTCLGYGCEGDVLFVGSSSGDISLYSPAQRNFLLTVRVCSGGVGSLVAQAVVPSAPAPAGEGDFQYARFGAHSKPTLLLVGGGDGSVVLLSLKDPKQPQLDERGRAQLSGGITSLSPSRPQDFTTGGALVGTSQGTMHYLQLPLPPAGSKSMGPPPFSESPLSTVCCVQFHPELNDRLATASHDGFLRLWDSSTYRVVSRCGG